MMYSTLREVYNVDTFEQEKKKKKHKKETIDESSSDAKPLYIEPVPTQCATPPSRKVSIENVQPYLDADLEQYLNNVSPTQTTILSQNSTPTAPVVNTPTPVANTPSSTSTIPSTPQVPIQDNKQDIFYKNVINIGLFIFIGILVIFLCDQITEIAVNIGMRKTVNILKPYLMRLEKLEQEK